MAMAQNIVMINFYHLLIDYFRASLKFYREDGALSNSQTQSAGTGLSAKGRGLFTDRVTLNYESDFSEKDSFHIEPEDSPASEHKKEFSDSASEYFNLEEFLGISFNEAETQPKEISDQANSETKTQKLESEQNQPYEKQNDSAKGSEENLSLLGEESLRNSKFGENLTYLKAGLETGKSIKVNSIPKNSSAQKSQKDEDIPPKNDTQNEPKTPTEETSQPKIDKKGQHSDSGNLGESQSNNLKEDSISKRERLASESEDCNTIENKKSSGDLNGEPKHSNWLLSKLQNFGEKQAKPGKIQPQKSTNNTTDIEEEKETVQEGIENSLAKRDNVELETQDSSIFSFPDKVEEVDDFDNSQDKANLISSKFSVDLENEEIVTPQLQLDFQEKRDSNTLTQEKYEDSEPGENFPKTDPQEKRLQSEDDIELRQKEKHSSNSEVDKEVVGKVRLKEAGAGGSKPNLVLQIPEQKLSDKNSPERELPQSPLLDYLLSKKILNPFNRDIQGDDKVQKMNKGNTRDEGGETGKPKIENKGEKTLQSTPKYNFLKFNRWATNLGQNKAVAENHKIPIEKEYSTENLLKTRLNMLQDQTKSEKVPQSPQNIVTSEKEVKTHPEPNIDIDIKSKKINDKNVDNESISRNQECEGARSDGNFEQSPSMQTSPRLNPNVAPFQPKPFESQDIQPEKEDKQLTDKQAKKLEQVETGRESVEKNLATEPARGSEQNMQESGQNVDKSERKDSSESKINEELNEFVTSKLSNDIGRENLNKTSAEGIKSWDHSEEAEKGILPWTPPPPFFLVNFY